jgi:hypothetical protein
VSLKVEEWNNQDKETISSSAERVRPNFFQTVGNLPRGCEKDKKIPKISRNFSL